MNLIGDWKGQAMNFKGRVRRKAAKEGKNEVTAFEETRKLTVHSGKPCRVKTERSPERRNQLRGARGGDD